MNRCSTDPSFTYDGRSVVVSSHGHVIADACESERVVTARIDANEIHRWRREFPALTEIR